MLTKFILHGGYADHINEKNDKFFQEILNVEKSKLKILLVYFAKDISRYNELKEKNINQFNRSKGEKDLELEVAYEDRFVEQVKNSDIVYLHGGDNLKLLKFLEKYDGLEELFRGKVIAGESAGAYVLSVCFYDKIGERLIEGLGFTPVKTICHYRGENQEKLEQCPKDLEKLLLKDYEYKVFNIDSSVSTK